MKTGFLKPNQTPTVDANGVHFPVTAFFPISTVAAWNLQAVERARATGYRDAFIVVNQGGSSSGKTWSILQVLFIIALSEPNLRITVVGQDVPNLKAGAIRDALDIAAGSPLVRRYLPRIFYNKSDKIISFLNGSLIEFKSYDDAQDAKSGKRDYLFLNEANGVSFDVYEALALRTKRQVFIDYNPDAEFWVHERLKGQPGVKFIYSNFTHNQFCPPSIVRKLLRYRTTDEQLWKIFGLGITGRVEGLIFPNYRIVPEFPADAKKVGFGLDFGFSVDPTALIKGGIYNGEPYLEELIYETDLTNPQLAARFARLNLSRNAEMWADSSDPRSIKELRDLNWNVKPVKKGEDSIRFSIQLIKNCGTLNLVAGSKNLIRERAAYKWAKKKKDDVTLNVPVDNLNHAMDASRYWALGNLGRGSGIIASS